MNYAMGIGTWKGQECVFIYRDQGFMKRKFIIGWKLADMNLDGPAIQMFRYPFYIPEGVSDNELKLAYIHLKDKLNYIATDIRHHRDYGLLSDEHHDLCNNLFKQIGGKL